MTEAATAQLLHSSAPGQFDAIVAQLGPIMGGSSVDTSPLKHEWQLSQGIGVAGTNATVGAANPLAAELKDKLLQYHQNAFSGAGGRGGIAKKVTSRVWLLPGADAGPSQFRLCSYAEKLDAQNMQAGHWKSTWTITRTSGAAEARVEGTIDVHTHLYEEGNTQLQLSQTFPGEVVKEAKSEMFDNRRGGPPTLANGVLLRIVECEHQILSILKGLHDLSADSLKQIRRVLPITKTKMNWEVEAQRGVKHLKKTAKR